MRGLLALVVIGSLASPALAQTAEEDRVVYRQRTVLQLEGRVIEGAVEGPRGTTIFIRKATRFKNWVQVRKSFRVELLSSSADL